jgi:phage baseplate assembly protein W
MTDTVFSDLSLTKGKVIINEDAIFQSVLSLLGTNKNERFFNPEYSANLDSMVFRLISYADLVYFESAIKNRIRKFEPRVTDLSFDILERYDNNEILLDIKLTTEYGKITRSLIFNSSGSS